MKAYVSLHTDFPRAQLDHEVSYEGYRRLEVDFDEEMLKSRAIQAIFPIVRKNSDQVATHVAIGAVEKGQGLLYLSSPILPHIVLNDYPERRTDAFWLDHGATPEQVKSLIELKGYTRPQIGIANANPVEYPAGINPIAREAHRLVTLGLLPPEEIHPRLFEMINDELAAYKLPVIQVRRGGAATMTGKMSQIRLSEWGNA